MRVSLAPYVRHMHYRLLPVLKSARTTSRGISLKPTAVSPPTQDPTARLAMLVTTATKASRATLPTLGYLAATPTVWTALVVGMVLAIATATPTMLTAAHDAGWLTNPPLLTMPRRPLLGLRGPALLSHRHRPPRPQCPQLGHSLTTTERSAQMAMAHRACSHPRGRVLVRMAATHRACSHPRKRVLVPNAVRAPCPHRSLHLALQPLRPLSAVKPPLR